MMIMVMTMGKVNYPTVCHSSYCGDDYYYFPTRFPSLLLFFPTQLDSVIIVDCEFLARSNEKGKDLVEIEERRTNPVVERKVRKKVDLEGETVPRESRDNGGREVLPSGRMGFREMGQVS